MSGPPPSPFPIRIVEAIWRRLLGRSDARAQRMQRLEARVRRLQEKLAEQGAAGHRTRARLKRAVASRRRRILSPAVLHGLLPLRARTIDARARHSGAAAADAWLQEASPSYREALRCALEQDAEPHPNLARTEVQGLTWWVPIPPALRLEARERFIAKQRFPYRNISQTREFSVGPIMLDLGANTGRMSIPRVILGDVQRAYCAEPDPLNFQALVRNVASNGLRGLVLADQAAIGSVSGTVRMRQSKYPTGHHLLGAGESGGIDVPCWTLDDWCRRLSIDPALVTYVKVDTQGWETHVLRGATGLLRHAHIAWQLEVTPAMLGSAGSSLNELYELCIAHFTHFVDLGKKPTGPRTRRTTELSRALGYLREGDATDIVLFNAVTRQGRGSRVKEQEMI